MSTSSPWITALICTRNRPEPLAKAVRSLLAETASNFELLVIDQSDDSHTSDALADSLRDPRLRYHRSQTRGKGAALNEGFRIALGTIVVCTDDDCEAPPNWVSDMARTLEAHPTAALLFCRVLPVPHDPEKGYVPVYEPRKSRLLRNVAAVRHGVGLGAAMALRRDFVLSLGGFDESFGPGARFPSADEWDIVIRTLLSGRHVYESVDVAVVHDGFRTFEEGRAHARRDWIALGAVCAKPLRARHYTAIVIPLWFFPTRALVPPLLDLLRLRRPRGLSRIRAFLQGFLEGFGTPVDPKTLLFRPRD